ncbi:MAG: selenocysteine-specific translation elongation factor [Candidatus Fischerbacteria bacterium RBG_13_37_8]|uniref:Selenocysteine-specific elongation factor n=1 Tax=Candidatus Fischerbacteria bacterium RBG_13_37_8 TaxID=1817863 RepID=A0A1F5V5Z3_9BACT|nr:MAG: selenocysteine-specific translation elongation factor [Candidatus Fischerbacteria bacterium RBG_13_37_8]
MKHFIIGTAGHIDHGKSALVNAITGINPDRLKEERERGITIDIGFAHFCIDENTMVSFIDVPGHEKFIRNMIAGAVGIDAVILVIAANESVKPQTVEHLQICELLGIKKGFIVLTKIDLVDDDIVALVTLEAKEFLKGTFLEKSPIIPVSSTNNKGIEEVKKHIVLLKEELEHKPYDKILRMPIDRSFLMKGYGIVVTGTIFEGVVHKNQDVEILPSHLKARIKKIQIHNQECDMAEAGNRAALNLAGIEKNQLKRGDVLVQPDSFHVSNLIEAKLYLFKNIMNNKERYKKLRFYHGTSENACIINYIPADSSNTLYAQLEIESPNLFLVDDRFILRTFSPMRTIGGGIILDISKKKYRKKDHLWLVKKLDENAQSLLWDKVYFWIKHSRYDGITLASLVSKTGFKEETIMKKIEFLHNIKLIPSRDNLFIYEKEYTALKTVIMNTIKKFQLKNPFEKGIQKSRLKTEFYYQLNNEIFSNIISDLLTEKQLQSSEDYLRLNELSLTLSEDENTIIETIVQSYKGALFSPPFWDDVKSKIANKALAEKIFYYLINKKEIIKVNDEFYFHRDAIENIAAGLLSFCREQGEMEVSDFKALFNTSRKYAIPLLEYFDKIGYTIRIGNKRKLKSE